MKNKSKTTIIVLLLFLGNLHVSGQIDTISYKFIYERLYNTHRDSNNIGTLKNISCISDSVMKCINRFFIKPNVYTESPGVFLYGQPYLFKKAGAKWYIKTIDKWHLFYAPNKEISPIVPFQRDKEIWNFRFRFIKYDTVCGYKCMMFKVEPIPKLKDNLVWKMKISAHINQHYWFNPQFGIVKVGNYSVAIRSDILPINKTDK